MKRLKYIFALTLIFFISCFADSDNTKDPNILNSKNFPEKAERIQKLGQQIKSFSKFTDAEFDLFNSGGFGNSRASTAPGPTDWDYKFAVKVTSSDLPKWRDGFINFTPELYDDSWTRKITSARSEDWKTTSVPKYYKRVDSDVMMMIYEEEGFIFKRVTAM